MIEVWTLVYFSFYFRVRKFSSFISIRQRKQRARAIDAFCQTLIRQMGKVVDGEEEEICIVSDKLYWRGTNLQRQLQQGDNQNLQTFPW